MPMSDTLTLYIGEKNISSWSMRPYVALTEKGLPFEEKTISLREDKDRSRRRAIGATGRVPVLHHARPSSGQAGGGEPLVIEDSLAIIEYIEEAFPPPSHPALWPADRDERARARSLAATMHSGFAKMREGMSFNMCFLPASSRPPATPESLADAAEMMEMWEAALARKKDPRPFLFGPFGAVDAMFAPAVVRVASFEASTRATPRAVDYISAVLAHSSVKRWLDPARTMAPVSRY